MSTGSPNSVRLPEAVRKELELLTTQVAVKQLELQNAQLRRELAMIRTVAAHGLYGHKVTFDLDTGLLLVDGKSSSSELEISDEAVVTES